MAFEAEKVDVLSSGQRRILAILYELSLMKKGSTVMIDEPAPLHINWQSDNKHIYDIFSPSTFILSTHSPNIIIGHTEKIHEVPPRGEV